MKHPVDMPAYGALDPWIVKVTTVKILLNFGYIYWSQRVPVNPCLTPSLNGRFCFDNNQRLSVIPSALQRHAATLRRLTGQSRPNVKLTSYVTMTTVEGVVKGAVKPHVTMYNTHPITPESGSTWPIATILHPSIQRLGFHQPFWSQWAWVTSVTLKGQGPLFPILKQYGSNKIWQIKYGSNKQYSTFPYLGKSEHCVRPQKMIQFQWHFFWIIFIHVEVWAKCAGMVLDIIKLNFPIINWDTLVACWVIVRWAFL